MKHSTPHHPAIIARQASHIAIARAGCMSVHMQAHVRVQIEASTRSTNKSFKKLIAEKLATPETIYETMCNQTVDLVFTAHPTQVGCLDCLRLRILCYLGHCHASCMLPCPIPHCTRLCAVHMHTFLSYLNCCSVFTSPIVQPVHYDDV